MMRFVWVFQTLQLILPCLDCYGDLVDKHLDEGKSAIIVNDNNSTDISMHPSN